MIKWSQNITIFILIIIDLITYLFSLYMQKDYFITRHDINFFKLCIE